MLHEGLRVRGGVMSGSGFLNGAREALKGGAAVVPVGADGVPLVPLSEASSFEGIVAVWGQRHPDAGVGVVENGTLQTAGPGRAESLGAELAPASVPERSLTQGTDVPYRLIRLSTVEPRRLSWLWKHYIPRRMVTMLAGDGARLKSTITLDIAARVSCGRDMPDGSHGLDCAADVIVLSTEDDLATVIVPRLKLAGAALARVHTLKLRTPEGDERDPLVTALDLIHLEAAIKDTGTVLVIFDPLAGFTTGTDMHKNDETRQMMASLHRLAEATDTAIVGVHHFSRAARVEASHRLTGSLAIVNAARSVLVVGPDPNDSTGRSLVLALSDKANLAPRSTPSLSYRADVPMGSEHPRIAWEGPSGVTACDLAIVATDTEERSAVDEAADFLREHLSRGPVKVDSVENDARRAGISQRTMERAKQRLKIKAKREGGAAGEGWWTWALPAAVPPSAPPTPRPVTDEGGGVSENPLPQATVPSLNHSRKRGNTKTSVW